MSARWHKVLSDLISNKTRTSLIVLSIAVGLFAVGTIVSSRSILSTEMARSYAAVYPSSGTVRTLELFDEGFVESVRGMPDVAEVNARRAIDAQIQVTPGKWYNITLFVVPDYEDMRVNKILPEAGAWPPPKEEMLLERSSLPVIGAEIGDEVIIKTPDERLRSIRVVGVVHDMVQLPSQFDQWSYGYISVDTLPRFGEDYGFNELDVVAENQENKDFARQVMNRVKSRAEKNGLTIPIGITAEPGSVPLDDILQAILALMSVLGLLSLFLSAFLIINSVSELLAQQKRQIGVMKAIGGRTSQILGMSLVMVSAYGVLALVLAVPLSVLGARSLSITLAGMFNFDLSDVRVPVNAVLLQLAVGLLVPILASLYPFLSNLRITAAEAISTYTMGNQRGVDWLDRQMSGERLWYVRYVLLRPVLLSLRNTFRSKGRLVLTLITLTLAGAIFVSVFSTQASLYGTVDELMQPWGFDVQVTFDRQYRAARVENEALQVAGVKGVDPWLQLPVRRVRDNGSESDTIILTAPRADSELYRSPVLVEGRWLLPDDDNALVVDTILLGDEPDLALGDDLVLKIDGRERTFHIVGVSMGFAAPFAYASYPYLARIVGDVGETGAALVATTARTPEEVTQVARSLEEQFERAGLRVRGVQTLENERQQRQDQLGIVITLLLVMAILLAIVGGLGLMGTMSINVLERTREIGVLRAIGAPNRGVAQVFILEGVAIGVLSWLLGSLFGLPLGKLLCDAVGSSLMGSSFTFTFSVLGVCLWLVVVVGLSAVASFLPARNATRLTVREVLAYE